MFTSELKAPPCEGLHAYLYNCALAKDYMFSHDLNMEMRAVSTAWELCCGYKTSTAWQTKPLAVSRRETSAPSLKLGDVLTERVWKCSGEEISLGKSDESQLYTLSVEISEDSEHGCSVLQAVLALSKNEELLECSGESG